MVHSAFLARPIAVALCAAPFRFTWREIGFVSWVGLRGAVPIFLATLPILAGLPGGRDYFEIAFVVVLASLVLQGWTVPLVAKTFGLDLPVPPEAEERTSIEVPATFDRDIAGFTVGARSAALQHDYGDLPLPRRSRILSVIRDGVVLDRGQIGRLEPGDYALTAAQPRDMERLDRLFGARSAEEDPAGVFGEFALDGSAPLGALNQLYGMGLPAEETEGDLAGYIARRLGRTPVVGDRVRAGAVELVVRELADEAVAKVGLEVAPEERARRGLAALPALVRRFLGRKREPQRAD